MFLHGFEERGLGLGRRAVDLVGQDHVGENGAVHERHPPALPRVAQDFGAGDVGGHEIGCELDALKFQMKDLRDRFHEERLGQTGSAGDQAVPAREEGNEEFLDDLFLADDDLGELGVNFGTAGDQLFNCLPVPGV